MDKEEILIITSIILLNIVGFCLGYSYGRGVIVKVDDCLIYEETLYCEPENRLQIDFG